MVAQLGNEISKNMIGASLWIKKISFQQLNILQEKTITFTIGIFFKKAFVQSYKQVTLLAGLFLES